MGSLRSYIPCWATWRQTEDRGKTQLLPKGNLEWLEMHFNEKWEEYGIISVLQNSSTVRHLLQELV